MSGSAAAASAGTEPVREGSRFDERRLEQWLRENVADFAGPLTVEQFRGGQSNPTFKLVTPERSYVMRRKPPGATVEGAHAVDGEARVMAALGQTGFPVAKVYGVCTDDDVLGSWFCVMEHIEGRIEWDSTLPGQPPRERALLYDAMNSAIADLHRIDPGAIGLSDFGKPGNYFERQISRWSRQYLADAEAGRDEAMDLLIERLPERMLADDAPGSCTAIFAATTLSLHRMRRLCAPYLTGSYRPSAIRWPTLPTTPWSIAFRPVSFPAWLRQISRPWGFRRKKSILRPIARRSGVSRWPTRIGRSASPSIYSGSRRSITASRAE